MHRLLAIALLGVAVFVPPLSAQMRGPVASAPVQASVSFAFGQPPQAHPMVPHNIPHNIFLPYFYPDYVSQPVTTQTPPPQIVFVQAPPAVAEVQEPSKPEALLIEWQGDRYVRTSGADNASVDARRTQPDYAQESNPGVPARKAITQVHDLPSVLLIFRDGRMEEVSSYAIVGGVMYVNSDYWSSGSWNRKVQLADLDLPASWKANQEHGVKFVLPAGPNQVVTRP